MEVGSVTDISEVRTASSFDSKDGGSMYLLNFGNTAYFHVGQRPKSKSNITMDRTAVKV
jgi:hypothetical protein